MPRKTNCILSSDVGPQMAARTRAVAKANHVTISTLIRRALEGMLARRTPTRGEGAR